MRIFRLLCFCLIILRGALLSCRKGLMILFIHLKWKGFPERLQ